MEIVKIGVIVLLATVCTCQSLSAPQQQLSGSINNNPSLLLLDIVQLKGESKRVLLNDKQLQFARQWMDEGINKQEKIGEHSNTNNAFQSHIQQITKANNLKNNKKYENTSLIIPKTIESIVYSSNLSVLQQQNKQANIEIKLTSKQLIQNSTNLGIKSTTYNSKAIPITKANGNFPIQATINQSSMIARNQSHTSDINDSKQKGTFNQIIVDGSIQLDNCSNTTISADGSESAFVKQYADSNIVQNATIIANNLIVSADSSIESNRQNIIIQNSKNSISTPHAQLEGTINNNLTSSCKYIAMTLLFLLAALL